MMGQSRRLVWFSCGAASAVVAKLAIERFGDRVDIVNAFVAAAELLEEFSERAAIGEYERGMSREDSEREARVLVGMEMEQMEMGTRSRR
jgi:PP-loop superfamily ATP-utilizing enzyme